ncbi:pyridoxamine 5'-phosphate oxidase family protein [Pleomorphovibrio marinus]|uniref:pyridoxamine 5'-phosphate oxidase family protein n=1 Tax=Pleomorphovibrio marinus TaxID=2164132 RepID=UPI000E0A096D|nr:pyridoxamine 5'-phosphate oxidase family protein [Pleomorphovibrio marinus]
MLFTEKTELSQVFELFQAECSKAVIDPNHPFRFITLSTFGTEFPNSRYVVLRAINQDFKVYFYTDSRSQKIAEIQKNPAVSLHLYHPEKKVQAKILGKASVHTMDEITAYHWKKVKGEARKAYCSIHKPGTKIDSPEQAHQWSENLDARYFSILAINPRSVELLQLNGVEHLRAVFNKKNGGWEFSWLAP